MFLSGPFCSNHSVSRVYWFSGGQNRANFGFLAIWFTGQNRERVKAADALIMRLRADNRDTHVLALSVAECAANCEREIC